MKNRLLAIGVLILLFTSCNSDKNVVELKTNKLEISMCSICGWCAGSDSLLVTEATTYYEMNTPCIDTKIENENATLKSDWNKLIDLLDKEEFLKIDINSCDVCFDGCDTWITLNDGGKIHTIRYGYNDSLAIKPIQPFIDKVAAIREKIKTNMAE